MGEQQAATLRLKEERKKAAVWCEEGADIVSDFLWCVWVVIFKFVFRFLQPQYGFMKPLKMALKTAAGVFSLQGKGKKT